MVKEDVEGKTMATQRGYAGGPIIM